MKPSETALHLLTQEYVNRQDLVRQIMFDVRPDILARFDKNVSPDHLYELAAQYLHYPQRGFWGTDTEWEYYFHGHGCRIVNTISQEPIEWDAPDIWQFDRYWLLNYLQWKKAQNSISNQASHLLDQFVLDGSVSEELVFLALDELLKSGNVTLPDATWRDKYRLQQ
jgi:hypothetical protein